MKYRASFAVALGALLTLLAGCKDSTPPFEPPGQPPVPVATWIFPASPTAFHASPGSTVTAPTVVVHDQFGKPMVDVTVHFTVVGGRGLIGNRVAATDAAGRATAGNWALGLEPGMNVVVATRAGLVPVAFMARGGLEPVKAVYGLARANHERVPYVTDLVDYRIGGYYLLYEDGTFTLGNVWGGVDRLIHSSAQVGLYSQVGSVITFEGERSTWTGSIGGDSLYVHGQSLDWVEVFAVTPPASATSGFPPVARPATVYNRQTPHSNGSLSRYVLYQDSAFRLQYVNPIWGFGEYPGRYSRADSVITFNFNGGGQATGTVRGDFLIVKYDIVMSLSDFEDGVYARAAGDATGGAHLYLANADGSEIAPLTPGSWPAWSPDSQRIAFQRDGDVHVINSDGSNEMRLVVGAYPAWSPDGRRIVFTSSEGIAVMDADGTGVTTLIRHDFRDDTYAASDMGVGKPAWSPEGEHIAFEHLGDGDIQPAQIYVMNADGFNPRLLTTSPDGRRYAESDPSWSPNGSRIAFWSYGHGIATVGANGGVPTTIYPSLPAVAYGAKPTWSPHGSTLAFTAHRGSSAGPAIWIVPADGGGARVLIPGGYDAAWSPDGARIAFVRGK